MSTVTPSMLLATDKYSIPYRPRFAQMLDSVTGAILLQQIMYRATDRDSNMYDEYRQFYKFLEPRPGNPLYRDGDSWTEELGFSRSELETARSKIAVKISKGCSVDATLADNEAVFDERGVMVNAQHLVLYWTDDSRLTWYRVNTELLDSAITQVYSRDYKRTKGKKPDYLSNARNKHYIDNATNQDSIEMLVSGSISSDKTPDNTSNNSYIADEDLFSNSSPVETKSHADLPVLHTQTGDESEQAESLTLIAETSGIKQSTVDQMSSGVETDSGDQSTRKDYSAPRRGPGRPPKSAAQVAMPLGRATTNGEAAKPRKRSVAQLENDAMLEAIEIEQKWKFNDATRGAARTAAGILRSDGATVEDIHNIYRSLKKTAYWHDKPLSLMSIAKKFPEWVSQGKPMNGASRYTDPAKTPAVAPKPVPVVNVVMASEEFF